MKMLELKIGQIFYFSSSDELFASDIVVFEQVFGSGTQKYQLDKSELVTFVVTKVNKKSIRVISLDKISEEKNLLIGDVEVELVNKDFLKHYLTINKEIYKQWIKKIEAFNLN